VAPSPKFPEGSWIVSDSHVSNRLWVTWAVGMK